MQKPRRLCLDLIFFSGIRTIMDTGQRMIISFLPIFARGLKVDLEEIALVISFRYLLGVFAPYTGLFVENKGTTKGMIVGMIFFIFAYGLFSIIPIYPLFFVLLIFATLGRMFFNPSMQAYGGSNSDLKNRGFVMSIPEIGWSAAAIIGVPIVGLLIEKGGWKASFPWFALLGGLILLGLWIWLPSKTAEQGNNLNLSKAIGTVINNKFILLLFITILLLSTSQAVITIIYSAHMEYAFEFQVTALGFFTLLLGIAELSGEGLSAFFSDRFKPGVAVCLGIGLHLITCLLMPVIGDSLIGAIIGLSLIFMSSEFIVVGFLPVIFSLINESKITAFSLKMTVHHGGVAFGIAIGPYLYMQSWNYDFFLSAALDLCAIILLVIAIDQANKTRYFQQAIL